MFNPLSVLLLLCFASLTVFAQTEKYTVPVKWERYKVSDKDVSVLLPKLPVLISGGDVCSEYETKQFASYADQTVYGLTITSKTSSGIPDFCSSKKKFSEKNFADRLTQLKNELKDFTETNRKINSLTVNRISGTDSVYWLINDFENKRWFELWAIKGDEEKAEVKNFIESIKINKGAEGIEIGSGADRTLGDENTVIVADEKKIAELKNEKTPLRIVIKPQPKYTDAARRAQTQGTVTLKVTFLANGGIGNITPVKALPYGLTEQAVFAAQRLVFIPPRWNDTPVSVSKTVVYNFTIY